MNIVLFELKKLKNSLIIWNACLALILFVFLSMYPSFINDIESSRRILSNIPLNLRTAIGLSIENFFTFLGFYPYLFNYILLPGAIMSMNIGVNLLSKERKQKTEDFLLTKPVNRSYILSSKIIAGLIALIITNIIYIFLSLVFARIIIVEEFSKRNYILITLSLLLVQLFFYFLGILLSVMIPKIKTVVSITIPVVFGFFIINIFDSIIGGKLFRFFSPFKFYDPSYITRNSTYEWQYFVYEILIILIFIELSFILFNHKDIPSIA